MVAAHCGVSLVAWSTPECFGAMKSYGEHDVDWDDVAAIALGPVEQAVVVAPRPPRPAPPPDQPIARAPAVISPCSAGPIPKVRPKWGIWLPAPQNRTCEQNFLAAARMREARAMQKHMTERQKSCSQASGAISKLRATGALRDHGQTVAVVSPKGGLTIRTGRSSGQSQLPWDTVLAIAYSGVTGRNDKGRSFNVEPSTAGRLCKLVAHCTHTSDNRFMDSLADSFASEAGAPLLFVVGMAADATKHRFIFEMDGFEDTTHVGRSFITQLPVTSSQETCLRFANSAEALGVTMLYVIPGCSI